MPSPIGHSLAALVVATIDRAHADRRSPGISLRQASWIRRTAYIGILVVAANAADVDFLPGFLIGSPDLFHRGNIHSLGAAALAGLVTYLVARLVRPAAAVRIGVVIGLTFTSHLLLDLCAADSLQWGLPVFWPVSERTFRLPLPLFLAIRREETAQGFFPSLLQIHNVYAILGEIVVMATVLGVTRWALGRTHSFRRTLRPRIGTDADASA